MAVHVPDCVQIANADASNNQRFSFQSVLGKGAFGIVLKAYDNELKKTVAVKLIYINIDHSRGVCRVMQPSEIRRRLDETKKEADLLRNLQHENVVKIFTSYEYGSIDDSIPQGFAIVTEYCAEGNLQRRLETSSRGEEWRHKWFTQLALAVKFIHSRGITHRDLKPANILIKNYCTLTICDVGVAKAVWEMDHEERGGRSFESYMSTLAGTSPYMAPEVWEGHYTSKSDIFSLGLIFFMIAEAPIRTQPMPKVKWGENCLYDLGKFLTECCQARCLNPTCLLVPEHRNSSQKEIDLIKEMLKFNYHDRPDSVWVINKLQEMRSPSDCILM